MEHLVSLTQIEGNLRRTASNGLISLLNREQLEQLAYKYFGIKDEYGNIIGYQCPYSGKIYTDYKDIVLEHIIPVNSKGGTVLFNCIPTSKEVNGANQKGAKHLISWWNNSKFWGKEAPIRLEKIVNYMLDAYNLVFEQHTIEEIESSYLEIDTDNSILDEEDNITYSEQKESQTLRKQAKENGIHSYLGFILDCINTLERHNIDITEIKNKLKSLEDKHIFEDIEKYQLYQNIIQKLIISRIGEDNRSYLTYALNFDIKKLMDSIKSNDPEVIYNEINRRLQNIERLLKENNLSVIEYFKSLRDISDIDIFYKNTDEITSDEIKVFLENVKIGKDTKIEIFIKMLNQGNSKILTTRNDLTLEGYPSIKLDQFWQRYKNKIKSILFEKLKDNPQYDVARITILTFYEAESYEELILKQKNKQEQFDISLDTKIEIFVKMLNQGNSKMLTAGNDLTLEGYSSIKLAKFWSRYQDKIKPFIFEKLKEDSTYDVARQTILSYYGVNSYDELITKQNLTTDEMIQIFIEMLNQGNNKILKRGNDLTLEGYPNVKLANFWHGHQDKIKPFLFEKLKEDSTYDVARQTILSYYGVNSYDELITKQSLTTDEMIQIFIEMLNQRNSKILTRDNDLTLEGYPNVKLAKFWNRHYQRILTLLFETLEDNPTYNVARQTIFDKYKVHTYDELIVEQKKRREQNELTLDTKIDIFINMLNNGNNKILKQGNIQTLEGYPNVKLANFWPTYQDKIKSLLFETLKDDLEYDIARQTVLKYFGVGSYEELEFIKQNNLHLRILCFIKMLNNGNKEILKTHNSECFDSYLSVPVGTFWRTEKNREIIIQTLFVKLKDNTSYETARKLILENLKIKKIEEYYEKIEIEIKKMKDNKKIKKQLEETIKLVDETYKLLDNEDQRKRA